MKITLAEEQIRNCAEEWFKTNGHTPKTREIIRRIALKATTFNRPQINAIIKLVEVLPLPRKSEAQAGIQQLVGTLRELSAYVEDAKYPIDLYARKRRAKVLNKARVALAETDRANETR